MEGKPPFVKIVRLRTVLYAAIIAVAGGIMIYTLATRDSEGISVIHDRNPMFVRLSDGARAQRLHHPHRQQAAAKARIHRSAVDGLPATPDRFRRPAAARRRPQLVIDVGPDQTREVRVVVTDYSARRRRHRRRSCSSLTDIATGEQAEVRDHFFGP